MDGWMGVKVVLWICFSNQKLHVMLNWYDKQPKFAAVPLKTRAEEKHSKNTP